LLQAWSTAIIHRKKEAMATTANTFIASAPLDEIILRRSSESLQ